MQRAGTSQGVGMAGAEAESMASTPAMRESLKRIGGVDAADKLRPGLGSSIGETVRKSAGTLGDLTQRMAGAFPATQAGASMGGAGAGSAMADMMTEAPVYDPVIVNAVREQTIEDKIKLARATEKARDMGLAEKAKRKKPPKRNDYLRTVDPITGEDMR
jgi:hypothetical protein